MFVTQNKFELAGAAFGLLCVILLILQNLWTWPIGFIYSVISLVVFYQTQLFADLGLHIFYAGMNAYGWYFWMYGGGNVQEQKLPITNISKNHIIYLTLLGVVGVVLLGTALGQWTSAEVVFVDSSIAVMSLIAMWMTARKQIESWILWWIVDIVSTALFLYKGIYAYAALYFVYLGLAVVGWQTWRRAQV